MCAACDFADAVRLFQRAIVFASAPSAPSAPPRLSGRMRGKRRRSGRGAGERRCGAVDGGDQAAGGGSARGAGGTAPQQSIADMALARARPALLRPADNVSLVAMSEADSDEAAEPGAGAPPLGDAYRAHWAGLVGYVLRNFGAGPPDPEDIAQQAFVRLSGVSAAVDNIGSFLRKTARNLVIDHYRGAQRTVNILKTVSILEENYTDHSPEDVLLSKEELNALNGVIATLPAKERVALLMHRIDGASFVEIADHLGVSHSGARLLVARAFERCAAAMEARP